MKSTPVLLLSQLSNFAPILAFVLFSDTSLYAEYIFVIFLAQIIWPLLTFRVEVQQQIELSASRRRFFLGVALQTCLIWMAFFAAASLVLPVGGGVVLSLFVATSLSVIGTVRSYAVGQPGIKGIMAFETVNILRNAAAFMLCWLLPEPQVGSVFIGAQLLHGAVLVIVGLWLLRPLRKWISWGSFRKSVVRRCDRILRFTFPSSLAGMISSRLPYIALEAAHSGPAIAGFIAANRMSLSPLSLILYALRIYGVKELNKRRRGEANHFRPMFWGVILGTPVILSPLLFPGLLTPLVRGLDPSWAAALEILPWLYPLSVLFFATGWMDRIFDIWGRQNLIFRIETVVLVLSLIIYVGISFMGWSVLVAQISIVCLGLMQCTAWLAAFIWVEFLRR